MEFVQRQVAVLKLDHVLNVHSLGEGYQTFAVDLAAPFLHPWVSFPDDSVARGRANVSQVAQSPDRPFDALTLAEQSPGEKHRTFFIALTLVARTAVVPCAMWDDSYLGWVDMPAVYQTILCRLGHGDQGIRLLNDLTHHAVLMRAGMCQNRMQHCKNRSANELEKVDDFRAIEPAVDAVLVLDNHQIVQVKELRNSHR